MAKQKERLELFRQLTGKTIIKPPTIGVPSPGFFGAKTKEYYR